LSDFRGRRLLLLFFNPRCGFCEQMAAELAALPTDGSPEHPLPLVITTGDTEGNRRFFQEHAIRCPVLLQEPNGPSDRGDLAARYQAGGTPMGYLIDAEGRIASELAAGAEALLRLAHGPRAAATNGKRARQGNRALSDSRIPRHGLQVGTAAPPFALPRVDGGELSLAEYRGRRLLLVFSDPACGPCDALLPRLEEAHRRSGSVRLLMVSRGEVEANRAKVRQHGITFPVVLQRHWEISRQYAMFATPMAYLIDEAGLIAAEVATGPDAVMKLLADTSVAPDGQAAHARCRCGKSSRECDCRRREESLAVPRSG
jgi:peroxiredoxin